MLETHPSSVQSAGAHSHEDVGAGMKRVLTSRHHTELWFTLVGKGSISCLACRMRFNMPDERSSATSRGIPIPPLKLATTVQGSDRTARRSHTKSRTGCRSCKLRKIRCDELHPHWFVRSSVFIHLMANVELSIVEIAFVMALLACIPAPVRRLQLRTTLNHGVPAQVDRRVLRRIDL